jgi:hypothetical protein
MPDCLLSVALEDAFVSEISNHKIQEARDSGESAHRRRKKEQQRGSGRRVFSVFLFRI